MLVWLQMPRCKEEWLEIAQEFELKWQFPHCLGALDGKHISILPPPNSGSQYYNYKHFFSIVLLALVDANYRFLYVDIGCCGRVSDGGVYNNSSLAKAFTDNSLDIPADTHLSGSDIITPYVVVADDAFALKPHQMKPFSYRQLTTEKQVFNYRLSRARRVVEHAFGILSQRFRVFGKAIPLSPEKAQVIAMAACCLHNFLLRSRVSADCYMQDTSGSDAATGMASMPKQGSNRYAADAGTVRDKFCQYFNSPQGAVSWQYSQMKHM